MLSTTRSPPPTASTQAFLRLALSSRFHHLRTEAPADCECTEPCQRDHRALPRALGASVGVRRSENTCPGAHRDPAPQGPTTSSSETQGSGHRLQSGGPQHASSLQPLAPLSVTHSCPTFAYAQPQLPPECLAGQPRRTSPAPGRMTSRSVAPCLAPASAPSFCARGKDTDEQLSKRKPHNCGPLPPWSSVPTFGPRRMVRSRAP